jgi:hypothetical protein
MNEELETDQNERILTEVHKDLAKGPCNPSPQLEAMLKSSLKGKECQWMNTLHRGKVVENESRS